MKEAAFAGDTGYLQIFVEMVSDSLKEARAALESLRAGEPLDRGVLVPSLEHLRFAAGQMGLPEWQELLQVFLSRPDPSAGDLEALISSIERLTPNSAALDGAAGAAMAPQQEAPSNLPFAQPRPQADLSAAGNGGFSSAIASFQNLKEVGAEIFAPAPGGASGRSMLAADPTYRAIFIDMVHDILREMEAALGEFEAGEPQALRTLTSNVDRLLHAARQIGMCAWLGLLAEYPREREISLQEARNFVAKIEAQAVLDAEGSGLAGLNGGGAADDPVREFFESLPPLLASVSSFGSLLAGGNTVDAAGFQAAIAEIGSMAALLGVRPHRRYCATAGERAPVCAFRRLELRLYEELVSVEQAMPAQLADMSFVPAAVLQNWCADQAFDTLVEVGNVLEEIHKRGSTPAECESVTELLRLIYYACRHYALETAAHLSMSLIDLFARARDDGSLPDPILLRIAASFIVGPRIAVRYGGERRNTRHGGNREALRGGSERHLHRQRHGSLLGHRDASRAAEVFPEGLDPRKS